nr:hypothetical protein CFP56_60682 [Quercus suber]
MSPDGTKAGPYKRYYDVFTWLVTQLTFSFVTAPFILLTIPASTAAWARVHFYAIIGTVGCSLFLLTPGKTWLQRKVKAHSTRPSSTLRRNESQERFQGATLGVPSDPSKEWDEMVDEIMEEVKRRSNAQDLPQGQELRKRVEETLQRTKSSESVKIH